MLDGTIPQSPEEEGDELHASLTRRLAALTAAADEARQVRVASEQRFEAARAAFDRVSPEFQEAEREFDELSAAVERRTRDASFLDRKLTELRGARETIARKLDEATNAVAQFRAVEQFTAHSRAEAEARVSALESSGPASSAQLATAVQRAAQERAAEERAARERAAAEAHAREFETEIHTLLIELGSYEESVEEEHADRDSSIIKLSAMRERLEALEPTYQAASTALAKAERDLAWAKESESDATAQRDSVAAQLSTHTERDRRAKIEGRLAAVRDEEERAARELERVEKQLRELAERERSAAIERAHIESEGMPLPAPWPAILSIETASHEEAPDESLIVLAERRLEELRAREAQFRAARIQFETEHVPAGELPAQRAPA